MVKKVAFEKAKTTTKKKSTGLGKLKIVIPEQGLRSLNAIKIIRKKDNKVISKREIYISRNGMF